jgi:multiple sugar transport system substrate-binding protein
MESWYWNVLAETSPDVAVTGVPFTDRNGDTITFLSGNGWAIPTGTKNPDLACLWAKTMTDAETWVKAAQARARADRAQNKPFTGRYTANRVADR